MRAENFNKCFVKVKSTSRFPCDASRNLYGVVSHLAALVDQAERAARAPATENPNAASELPCIARSWYV